MPTEGLRPYARNPRNGDTAAIVESLRVNGQYRPIVVREQTGEVLAGNHTLAAALELGWDRIAATFVACSDEEAARIVLVDNRSNDLARYDDGLLAQLLVDLPDLAGTGFDDRALADLLASLTPAEPEGDRLPGPTLADRFLVPPFTVLDARKGWWQDRKREWIARGIRSEEGRDANLLNTGKNSVFASQRVTRGADGRLVTDGQRPTTSIFDPTLCEVVYRWFAPPRGRVLDPYAGGSVRGVVAGSLGLDYLGLELRAEQVKANREQLGPILAGVEQAGTVEWAEGDNLALLPELPEEAFDLAFSCPPYFDLERYSEEEGDHSRLSDEAFSEAYHAVMAGVARALRPDSFAVFVVGNARDKDGLMRDLGGLTVRAAEAAGLRFYNDAILVSPSGSLALRAGLAFSATRVLGRCHQQVLVFVKGDRRRAAERQAEVQLHEALTLLDPGEVQEGEEPVPAEPADEAPARPVAGRSLAVAVSAQGEPVATAEGSTPVERWGDVLVKRDDLFTAGGLQGGKVRSCLSLLSQPGVKGAVTAGSRHSPQVEIVAGLAAELGLPCSVHVPAGDDTPALTYAAERGAEVNRHRPGHNSVIVARARKDAEARGWLEVPFGMECAEAVQATAKEAATLLLLPEPPQRIVVPVGSGMSLAGILHGLAAAELGIPVVGIVVGADPQRRLARWAPAGWEEQVELRGSGLPYEKHPALTSLGGLDLDPVYEAKCLPALEPGDLLWVVGKRRSA